MVRAEVLVGRCFHSFKPLLWDKKKTAVLGVSQKAIGEWSRVNNRGIIANKAVNRG